MLGTIVNTCTILIGGTFGALVRSGIGDKYKTSLFNALGLCCLVLGANATLPNMARSEYPVLFILSLAIGGIIGTRLDLSGRIDRLNARLASSVVSSSSAPASASSASRTARPSTSCQVCSYRSSTIWYLEIVL